MGTGLRYGCVRSSEAQSAAATAIVNRFASAIDFAIVDLATRAARLRAPRARDHGSREIGCGSRDHGRDQSKREGRLYKRAPPAERFSLLLESVILESLILLILSLILESWLRAR